MLIKTEPYFRICFQKYKHNAVVKPNQVSIKTEHDIELNIKREIQFVQHDSTSASTSAESVSISQNSENCWNEEKQMLINKIVTLKAEIQNNTMNLKGSEDQLDNLKQELKSKNEIHLKEVNDLQNSLSALNNDLAKMKSGNDKRILELTKENKLLQARFNQLQKSFPQNEKAEKSANADADEAFYDVERLLDHKFIKKRTFLVRWEGFDSSHDSWVEESDLQCSSILAEYKKSKRLR